MNDRASAMVEHGFDEQQLRTLLKTLGHPVRGKMKRETMLARIQELEAGSGREVQKEPRSSVNTVVGLDNPIPAVLKIGGCSEAEVMEAVAENLTRGMTAAFAENCWQFERKGRKDSGTMSQPIYNIKKCADLVCQDVPMAKATGDAPRYA